METTNVHPLKALCKEKGLTIEAHAIAPSPEHPKMDAWEVTLTYQGRKVTTNYYTGHGHRKRSKFGPEGYQIDGKWGKPLLPSTPSEPADIVWSLLMDASCASDTFDSFCSEMGYSTDSRKALETYLACQANTAKLRKLLLSDFVAFEEASQDY